MNFIMGGVRYQQTDDEKLFLHIGVEKNGKPYLIASVNKDQASAVDLARRKGIELLETFSLEEALFALEMESMGVLRWVDDPAVPM